MFEQLILVPLMAKITINSFSPALGVGSEATLHQYKHVYQLAQTKSVKDGLNAVQAKMVQSYGSNVSVGNVPRNKCQGDVYEYTVSRFDTTWGTEKRSYACFNFITGSVWIEGQALK
jgi:hypothetical protein